MATKKNCPVCGSLKVSVDTPKVYMYEECGLEDVILQGNGVDIFDCDDCGNKTTGIHDEQQLLQVLGISILAGPPGMSGVEFRYLRTIMGLTQADMAKEMGKPRRETISEWESRDRVFPEPFDEIGPRTLLLGLFLEKVVDSDHCHLSDSQLKELGKFTDAFLVHVRNLIESATKDRKISIKRRPIKREWQPMYA